MEEEPDGEMGVNMKIESNITVMSKGAQEREQIEKTKSNKSGKTIFAGEFEGDFLLQDRIQQKKEQARKQAMKIVSDAWNGDRKIYEEIDKSNTHAADLRQEKGEMRSEQNRLKESMEELRKAYGVDPDSEEEKDLELMKKAQATMNGFAGEALTEEEWAKWNEVSKKERTEYQSRVLELNKL